MGIGYRMINVILGIGIYMDICVGNTCKNLMRMMWIYHMMSTLIEECKKNKIMQEISNFFFFWEKRLAI
jgi:hypothetical protein